MKTNSVVKLAAAIAGALLAGDSAQAAAFSYQNANLLVGFRNGGASDLVVNLGPITSWYAYSSLPPNTTHNITAYNGTQLTSVFGSLDNISFSAFADVRTTTNPNFPIQTLWTTVPRLDISVQSDPLNRRSQFQQANTAAKIDGVANGGITFSGLPDNDPATNVTSSTALEIPKDWNVNGTSYTIGIGPAGNFNGTFPANVENTTPSAFASGGIPIVSDLYELRPGSGEGNYLGYFTFGTDGSMTFTTVPEPGSLSLIGAGFGLLALARHFRRKTA